jgi:hypothetical protein
MVDSIGTELDCLFLQETDAWPDSEQNFTAGPRLLRFLKAEAYDDESQAEGVPTQAVTLLQPLAN